MLFDFFIIELRSNQFPNCDLFWGSWPKQILLKTMNRNYRKMVFLNLSHG